MDPVTQAAAKRVHRRDHWVTLRVATDTVPLLIHSCSRDCTLSVPAAPANYFERPHKGGAASWPESSL